MVHRIFWVLLLVTLLFGSPIAAMMLFNAMGPWDATAIEHDGSLVRMRFDQGMKPPDFITMFPGASVVQGSELVSKEAPSGVGSLELAVRGSAEQVRDFYRTQLRAAGFAVNNLVVPNLNPAVAAYLGIDGDGIVAKRTATDDIVTVQIRTEEGLIVRSRLVQVSWRKISEWPAFVPAP